MWTVLSLTTMLWAQEPEQQPTPDAPTENSDAPETKEKSKKAKEKKEPKPKKEKNPKAAKPNVQNTASTNAGWTAFSPHLILGMETGAALSTTDLRASFLPQWHFGVQLPYWNERLGVVFQGVYRVSQMDAKGSADTLTSDSYTFNTKQQEGEVGMNLRVRIPEVPVVTPEIWLGPSVQMLNTTMTGNSGSAFPTTTEQVSRIGFHAALLGEYALPVGQLIGGVHYTTYEFRSTIQGDTRNHAISPTIGYRYRFF